MASPFLLLLNVRGLVGSEWTACLIVWTGQVPTCDNTHVTCATVWHTRSRSVKDGEGGGGEGKWETPKNRRREEGWRDRSSQRQRTKQFTFQAAGEASSQCWLFHWRGVKKTKKKQLKWSHFPLLWFPLFVFWIQSNYCVAVFASVHKIRLKKKKCMQYVQILKIQVFMLYGIFFCLHTFLFVWKGNRFSRQDIYSCLTHVTSSWISVCLGRNNNRHRMVLQQFLLSFTQTWYDKHLIYL